MRQCVEKELLAAGVGDGARAHHGSDWLTLQACARQSPEVSGSEEPNNVVHLDSRLGRPATRLQPSPIPTWYTLQWLQRPAVPQGVRAQAAHTLPRSQEAASWHSHSHPQTCRVCATSGTDTYTHTPHAAALRRLQPSPIPTWYTLQGSKGQLCRKGCALKRRTPCHAARRRPAGTPTAPHERAALLRAPTPTSTHRTQQRCCRARCQCAAALGLRHTGQRAAAPCSSR